MHFNQERICKKPMRRCPLYSCKTPLIVQVMHRHLPKNAWKDRALFLHNICDLYAQLDVNEDGLVEWDEMFDRQVKCAARFLANAVATEPNMRVWRTFVSMVSVVVRNSAETFVFKYAISTESMEVFRLTCGLSSLGRQGTAGAASASGSAILPYYPAKVTDSRGTARSEMKDSDTHIESLVSIATADKVGSESVGCVQLGPVCKCVCAGGMGGVGGQACALGV